MKWLVLVLCIALSGCLAGQGDLQSIPAGFGDGLCESSCVALVSVEDGEVAFVRATWNGTLSTGVNLTAMGEENHDGLRGFDASRLRLGPGNYTVFANSTAPFKIQVTSVEAGKRLLPNLVTMKMPDIAMGPCSYYERSEQGAHRCLRLGNSVGNVGLGPLEVRLAPSEGVEAIGGQGQFVQRIFAAGGGFEDVPVGGAQFHTTHAHFHYADLATFRLYEVDEDGLRGAQVAAAGKSGFCFIDIGAMHDADVQPASRRGYAAQDCLVPTPGAWRMGISVGWYDYYPADLDEQYVEVSGVTDGTYELVSIADGANTLLESDETDNAASVLIRLRGDDVDVLEHRSFYRAP